MENEFRGPGQESLILQKGESFSILGNYRILAHWDGLRSTPGDITHFLQWKMTFRHAFQESESEMAEPENRGKL